VLSKKITGSRRASSADEVKITDILLVTRRFNLSGQSPIDLRERCYRVLNETHLLHHWSNSWRTRTVEGRSHRFIIAARAFKIVTLLREEDICIE
jgi:hypothetical protein